MWRSSLRYGAVGLEMGIAIGGCFLVGNWLDGKYDTKPYLGLVGLLFGIAVAFRAIIRVLGQMKRDLKDEGEE